MTLTTLAEEEIQVESKMTRSWVLRRGPHVVVTGETDGGERLTVQMPGHAELVLSRTQAQTLVKLIGLWERTL